MMKFALACEGITDQIVIKNILRGYYENQINLKREIRSLQPPFDETTQKQIESGGWKTLRTYLRSKRFRDDVLNNRYIVVQIDTDIAHHFKISPADSVTQWVNQMIETLVEEINQKENFYDQHKEKILFAVCVHSLECWLLALHQTNDAKNNIEKIDDCFDYLKSETEIFIDKKPAIYEELSQPFLKNTKLLDVAGKNSSLNFFLQNLPETVEAIS